MQRRATILFMFAGALLHATGVGAAPFGGLGAGDGGPVSSTVDASSTVIEGLQPEPSRSLLGSGLLDASRFSLRHSVSYGVYSGSEGSRSSGLWLSELGYRLADPLEVSVDVGMVLDPERGELFNAENVYLHGLNLDYRPSRNFQMRLSYRNLPPNSPYRYGNPHPAWPWSADPVYPGRP
jgi:hypothetical protein